MKRINHEIYEGQINVTPDYLRVDITNKSDIEKVYKAILTQHNIFGHLIHSENHDMNPSLFGNFEKPKLKENYLVLSFIPYSIDVGRRISETPYITRGKALRASIEFLKRNQIEAKPINLEKMVQ